MPVKAATDDYLSITLADIIIAWYNASGVAIGDTQLANAIYDAYGSITLDDLVENDCLTALDVVIAPNTPEMREYVRELIGYGNLTVSMIHVQVGHLQNYLSGFPVSDVARQSLEAMFGWDGNGYNEFMFAGLGMAIGSVANIGKIAYQCAVDTLTDITQTVQNSYLGKTLLDVYRHFTDSTYFQDLLVDEGGDPDPSPELVLNFDSGGYDGIGFVGGYNGTGVGAGYCFRLNTHVFGYLIYGNTFEMGVYNNTSSGTTCQRAPGQVNLTTGEVIVTGDWIDVYVPANSFKFFSSASGGTYNPGYVGGYAIMGSSPDIGDKSTWCINNDPWNGSGGSSGTGQNGVTKYINNSVGNIASDNYINLSPNIGTNEYMYVFDRLTYIETLNQITENTDNGDYSNNSTVINNYNNTYIEQPAYVTIRPSTAPADPDQPAQPFISPRPTQAPEEYEGIIYEGGISEEITKKFPFCIPWDIKAMIDRLWVPEARAPYIHWEATFGSWGKLGEVDVDLEEFSGVAVIFRSTTLLLWIVWLVIITRDLLG